MGFGIERKNPGSLLKGNEPGKPKTMKKLPFA
jgi:hypothetical protein